MKTSKMDSIAQCRCVCVRVCVRVCISKGHDNALSPTGILSCYI